MNFSRFSKNGLLKFRLIRIAVGILFVIFGILGFLPIVGYWMIPVGLVILSVDFPIIRRWRRRVEVRWGRYRAERKKREKGDG